MSKLIDKLREIYEGPAQSIGFKRAPLSSNQSMVILALLTKAESIKQGDVVDTHADAVLVSAEVESKETLQGVAQQLASGLPWGMWAKECSQESLRQLMEIGSDFVVFDPDKASAAVIQVDDIGKIIKVGSDDKDTLIGTISQMGVDAVLIEIGTKSQPRTTVHDIMLCRWVARVTSKPLLVVVSSDLSEDELRALWEAGAGGVVVRVDGKQPKERLARLRQIISALPPRRSKQREGSQALLPRSETDASV